MTNLFARFVKDEEGATAIEYGLIAALLSVAIVATLKVGGGKLDKTFETVNSELVQ